MKRLRYVSAHIEEKCKKNASGILSFRLSYDPQHELLPEEPYELWLSIVYIADKDEYATMAATIAQDLKTKFPNLLEKAKDNGTVDLRECKAVSEMEFTVRDMRDTVEYTLEHLQHFWA